MMDSMGDVEHTMHLNSNEYSGEIVKNFENNLIKIKKNSILKGIEKFSEGEINEEPAFNPS